MTIISFKHQFIFIKTGKMAGTSLEIALSYFCGRDDIVTEKSDKHPSAGEGVRDVMIDGQRHSFNVIKHMKARHLRKELGGDMFRRFLKISTIRNPYDMVVSIYAWRQKEVAIPNASHFRTWLPQFIDAHLLYNRRPLCTIRQPYDAIDVMIRFEHFEEDLTALSQRLGLQDNIYDTFKGIRKKANIRPKSLTARACFEGFPEGIERIKRVYAIELDKFGYDLPWLPGGLSGGLSAEEEQQA